MASQARVGQTFRKFVVTKLTHNFREATSLETGKVQVPAPGRVLVKTHYVGINASDINYTAGRYDNTAKPPFDAGFEGIGQVVASSDTKFNEGQYVAFMHYGSFAEFLSLPSRTLFPVPSLNPEYLTLLVSGLTAKISLSLFGALKAGETVLVTPAAGGTGQFAVQLAKLSGCHVIGTCSTSRKADFLKHLGCSRVINTSEEELGQVLKTEYAQGIDVVYESVGADVFDTCVNHLAIYGRLIVIGYVSSYKSDKGFKPLKQPFINIKLLTKSASIHGFFLFNHSKEIKPAFKELLGLYEQGKLTCTIDRGEQLAQKPFSGIESIPDAIDYMYSRQSLGKIVVKLTDTSEGQKSRL